MTTFPADLSDTSSLADAISFCLNTELGAYSLKTHVSPDKISVLIDDQNMCKLLDFFKGKSFAPVITTEHTERIKTVVDFAKRNKIDFFWAQSGLKKKYYYFKQFGFNGVNLLNLLSINTANAAATSLLSRKVAELIMQSVVTLSWSGSLFFSTLENYILNFMLRTKIIVGGLKVIIALPIRCV